MNDMAMPITREGAVRQDTYEDPVHQRARAQAQAGIDLLWVCSHVHMVKHKRSVIGVVCEQGEGVYFCIDTLGHDWRADSREDAIDILVQQMARDAAGMIRS